MRSTILAEIRRLAPLMAWDEVYRVNPTWFDRVMTIGPQRGASATQVAQAIIREIEQGHYVDGTPAAIYVAPENVQF